MTIKIGPCWMLNTATNTKTAIEMVAGEKKHAFKKYFLSAPYNSRLYSCTWKKVDCKPTSKLKAVPL